MVKGIIMVVFEYSQHQCLITSAIYLLYFKNTMYQWPWATYKTRMYPTTTATLASFGH
jgi:hypothetical protein